LQTLSFLHRPHIFIIICGEFRNLKLSYLRCLFFFCLSLAPYRPCHMSTPMYHYQTYVLSQTGTLCNIKFNQTIFSTYITVFWDATPCSLVDAYWHFRGTYCLHLQCRKIFIYQSTLRHIPEDGNLHNHRHENLKSWDILMNGKLLID
jgi:hypothetical protein